MAAPRTFAALIDQDSVAILEYKQEKAGFRVIDSRSSVRRFATPEAAADAVVQLLAEVKARNVSLSIVLQHFGSFFHSLVLPNAPDDVIRPIIVREVQRTFNVADPALAFSVGGSTERRDAERGGTPAQRQVLVAGAPSEVVAALRGRLTKAKIAVNGLTVIPEVFRRLYDSLDGSTEATAMLICLQNGPHVAFFVNGRLELAIEPPLSLDGEAPLDSAIIVDQLERGAIFLRQQSRGTVATRLLLAASAAEYDTLASTIEARTGMRVAQLGHSIGTPEMVVAMGSVLGANDAERLDLLPRAPSFDARVRGAMSGPSAITTTLAAAAALAAIWCSMQVVSVSRAKRDLEDTQRRVNATLPAVDALKKSAQGRERIAGIRTSLAASRDERDAVRTLLIGLASSAPLGTQLSDVSVLRVAAGWETTISGHATGPNTPAAITAANAFYSYLQQQRPKLEKLTWEINSYSTHADSLAPKGAMIDQLNFTVTFLSPAPGAR